MRQKELEARIFPAPPEGVDLYQSLEGLDRSIQLSSYLPKKEAMRLAAAGVFFLSACAPEATPRPEVAERPTPASSPTVEFTPTPTELPSPTPTETAVPTETPTPTPEAAMVPEDIFPIYATLIGHKADGSAGLMLTRLPQEEGTDYLVYFQRKEAEDAPEYFYRLRLLEEGPGVYQWSPPAEDFELSWRYRGRAMPLLEIRAGETAGEIQANFYLLNPETGESVEEYAFTLRSRGSGREPVYAGIREIALQVFNSGPWDDGNIGDLLGFEDIELP